MFKKRNQIQVFYSDQNRVLRQLIHDYQIRNKNQIQRDVPQINILMIGTKKSGKNSLTYTLNVALNNLKQLNKKNYFSSQVGLTKIQLSKTKKYIVEGQKMKQINVKPAINIFKFNQKIAIKGLGRYYKLIQSSDQQFNTNIYGQKIKMPSKISVRSIIFCMKIGDFLTQEQIATTNLILIDAKQKKFKPIIALTHTDKIDKRNGQNAFFQKLELQIMKISLYFDIPREQIFPIQCYHQDSILSQEINYYALKMIYTALKQAKDFSKLKQYNTIKKAPQFFLFCGC